MRNLIKVFFCVCFVCLLVLVFLTPKSFAEIFAWEYNNCIQKCTPKENCCKETCGYRACIKHNTTREGTSGADLTDTGASDAAMAVCYPHLDVMRKCHKALEKQGGELVKLRDEYCTLAAAKTRTYANKDACVSTSIASEKNGKLSEEYIIKIYKAAIARFKKG